MTANPPVALPFVGCVAIHRLGAETQPRGRIYVDRLYPRRPQPCSPGCSFLSKIRQRRARVCAYFFAPGGKCSNIFWTPLSRFLMFLSDLSERVSLDDPLQTMSLVFASNKSTTRVPTL